MSISQILKDRNITEILHFTTNHGLLGILDSKAVSSRLRLNDNDRLEFILKLNSTIRRDEDWIDYVNLSISRINSDFFNSCQRWHMGADVWWCILAFKPEILTHNGIYFTTTNNIYTSVKRYQECNGLNNLFARQIVRWNGNVVHRSADLPDSCPTCLQAEVLYPERLSTESLYRIYVRSEEDLDQVYAQLAATDHPEVEVILSPEKFVGMAT